MLLVLFVVALNFLIAKDNFMWGLGSGASTIPFWFFTYSANSLVNILELSLL